MDIRNGDMMFYPFVQGARQQRNISILAIQFMHTVVASPKDTENQWSSCFGASEAKNIVPQLTKGNHVVELLSFIIS